MLRTFAIISVSIFFISSPVRAEVSCGEQPKDVPTDVQEQLESDVKGKAQLFTKLLGDAELSGKIKTAKREIYDKHQNLDKLLIDRYTIWVSCQNIMSDGSLSTPQKTELWIKVYRELSLGKSSSATRDWLRNLRLKETGVEYVRSALGAPRFDIQGIAIFEIDGYKITIGYYTQEDKQPTLTGLIYAVLLQPSRNKGAEAISLPFDGDWVPYCPNVMGLSESCTRVLAPESSLASVELNDFVSNPAMLSYICSFDMLSEFSDFFLADTAYFCDIRASGREANLRLYIEQDEHWAKPPPENLPSHLLWVIDQETDPKKIKGTREHLAEVLGARQVDAVQIFRDRELPDELVYRSHDVAIHR